jgi:hypothetical protein
VAGRIGARSRTPQAGRVRALRYRLVIMVLMPFVVAACWHVAAAATPRSGNGKLGPVIPARQAERIAMSTMNESHGSSLTWVVTHSTLHPISFIVSDSAGSPRFGSSMVACPSRFLERVLRRMGGCPPPPVWAVQVETASRTADHKALVEVDAFTGQLLAWQVDDTLP